MEGTRPNAYDYGGPPAPTGRALPNLINAVKMLKSKSTSLSRRSQTALVFDFDFDVDFSILTAFIRLGRAGPAGAGCPP